MTLSRDIPYDRLRALSIRNKNEAKHEDLFAAHGFNDNPPVHFSLPLDKCQIPVEAKNVLLRQGLKELGDLTHFTREDLKKFNGLGDKRAKDVFESLSINGGMTLDDLEDEALVAQQNDIGAAFYKTLHPDNTHDSIQEKLNDTDSDVSNNSPDSITAHDLFSDEARLLFVNNHLNIMPNIKTPSTKEGALTRAKRELLERPIQGKDYPILHGEDSLTAIASKDAAFFIEKGVSKPSANLLMKMVDAVGGITPRQDDTDEKRKKRAVFTTLLNDLKQK